MTIFIILCVLMCVAAVAAVCLPLWFGSRAKAESDHRSQVLVSFSSRPMTLRRSELPVESIRMNTKKRAANLNAAFWKKPSTKKKSRAGAA